MSNDTMLIGVFLVLFLLTAGIVYAMRAAHRPFRKVRLERIPAYLEMLLKRGHNGALLILTEAGSQRFVQCEKYVRPGADMGLLFSFPRAPWSEEYYPQIEALCIARGIPVHKIRVTSGPTRGFLDADLGQDIDAASDLVQGVFLEVFKVPKPCLVDVQTSGISPRDETVAT